VVNLDPEVQTNVRVYSADGSLRSVHTVSGETTYILKAGETQGFYLVEISGENMKSTLRYIVK